MIDLCERCHDPLDPESRDGCETGLCEDCTELLREDCEGDDDECQGCDEDYFPEDLAPFTDR